MSKVPLNAPDATAISFSDWMQYPDKLDSELTGNADVRRREISTCASLGADDTWRNIVGDEVAGSKLNDRSWNGSLIRMHGSDC